MWMDWVDPYSDRENIYGSKPEREKDLPYTGLHHVDNEFPHKLYKKIEGYMKESISPRGKEKMNCVASL